MGAIRLRTVPLFGTDVAFKSFIATRQRRLNVYYDIRSQKDKSTFTIYGTPGLSLLAQPTITTNTLRGILGTPTNLFIVGDGTFQSITSLGPPIVASTPASKLTTSSGYVSLATNNTQVLIADGSVGMIYNVASNTLSPIGGSYPNNAQTNTFVSSFFIAEEPGTQRFWVSNANDGSTWQGTSFASASAFPGYINAVDSLSDNLLLFCTDHIEFWQDVGATPEPFAPIVSASTTLGLGAVFSRAHLDDGLCFLSINMEGQYQVAQINGYQLGIISTPDIDAIINSLPDAAKAVGLSYGVDSHKFYQITFPESNRSLIYDSLTQVWGETQTGASLVQSRHIGDLSTTFNGQTIISDYSNNNLYTMDPGSYTDNGQVIPREIITKHVSNNFNRFRVAKLYLDMETGVGLANGQGSDPQIMLMYSKDNGRTWSGERWKSLGKAGEYLSRVEWRRFGSTRDATFKIRMTDPVKFVIADAAMTLRDSSRQTRKEAG